VGRRGRPGGRRGGVPQNAHKTCVFSQFTKSLDMMEHELAEAGIGCASFSDLAILFARGILGGGGSGVYITAILRSTALIPCPVSSQRRRGGGD